MRTLCYSVRLKSLHSISEKAVKAVAYDGSEAILPKSHVFGVDYEVERSDAWWISEWILQQKSLQFSRKKSAWFDTESRKRLPDYIVEKHIPERINPKHNNIINELKNESKSL